MPDIAPFAPSMVTLAFALSVAIGELAQAAPGGKAPVSVEVFTARDVSIRANRQGDPALGSATVEVYELEGIEKFQASLSEHLSSDPNTARRAVRARVGQVDGARVAALQRSAMGLLKASEYGIDRYPAIVLDGKAVVYGVTDVGEAVRLWRARARSVSP